MKKFKKVFSVLLAVTMTAVLCVPAFAADSSDIGSSYAVYLVGNNDNGIHSEQNVFNISGSAKVYGNLAMYSGDYQIGVAWDRSVTGTIYPGLNSKLVANGNWAEQEIKRLYDIAEPGKYTATMPQAPEYEYPDLEQKGGLSVVNEDVTISENGWYTSIDIGGNPNTLTFDVSDGKELHVRVDNLTLNGNIELNGNGKVYLYINEFDGKNGTINAKNVNSIEEQPLNMFFKSNFTISHGLTVASNIFAQYSNADIGAATVVGNLYAGDQLTIGANAELYGLYYAPNADVQFVGNAALAGKLIANRLTMADSAVIAEGEVTGWNPVVPTPAPVDPEVTPEPENTPTPTETPDVTPPPTTVPADGFANGLLGEYYDRDDLSEQTVKLARIDKNIAFNWHLDAPDSVIEPETFSVQWTGYISPAVSGNYRFKTYSDDGVKMSVGDQVLIDRWGLVNLEYTVAQETIYLEAGQYYEFSLEYQQLPINATIFLFWESEEVQSEIVPANVFFVEQDVYDSYITPQYPNAVKKEGTGLLNQFSTESVDGPYQAVEISNINYEWGDGAPEGIDTDTFYGKMTGYIEAKYTEPVKLSFIIDDAIRVWIDGELIIDAWEYHSNDYVEGTFNAVAGQMHKIEIEYADMGIGATCVMRWEDQSGHVEVVPVAFLYPENK